MKIVVISGTPGSGKTSVANEIKKKENADIISINELAIKEGFTQNYDKKRDTYIIDFEKFTPFLVERIKNQSDESIEFIIIEGHFSDIVPNEMIDLAIVLRCHPDILVDRLKTRDYKKEKIIENVQAEILANCLNYFLEKELQEPLLEIDTSNLSIEDLALLIIELIKGENARKKYEIGKIDWLELLFQEERMQEFFD